MFGEHFDDPLGLSVEHAEAELKLREARDALRKIRDLCTYSNLISGKREPRFVITSGKDIVAIVDAVLGGG